MVISPIVHPQRWHPDNFELVKLPLSLTVHPLLAPILTARVPKTCRETTMFCLRYLQSGGHSVKTRNSLKPLLKSGYFTSLLRFRTRPRRHPSRRCLLVYQDLRSMWWGNHPERPISYIRRLDKFGVEVPISFFSFRSEYASNYDPWYTYRHALVIFPVLLLNAPPDSQLASMAANCIFGSFCTAYPRETRKAKMAITQYLSRCRPIRAMPSGKRNFVEGTNGMDVD